MAKGLSLWIGSDTKDAVRGLNDIEGGLEKVQDELGDTAKDSQKLERKFSDDMRDMQQASQKTGRAIGDDIRDGTRRASRGMDDFRDESKQSLRETAASVRDVSDGLDAVQEIAANAFIGFGPAGLVAGLTAAAGVGFISAAFDEAQQAADETKARIRSMYQEAAEEGRAFLDEEQVIAEARNILYDENQSRYQQVLKDAKNLGLPWQEVLRAMAGEQEALNNVLDRTNELEQARNDKLENAKGPLELRGALMTAEGQTLDEINARYSAQQALITDNVTRTEQWLATQTLTGEEIQKANKRLAETPKTLPTVVSLDTSQVDNYIAKNISKTITVDFRDRAGRRVD